MRSKVAERILAKTPEDVRIFVKLHADIVVRVNQLLNEKGYTQKKLAEKLDKRPSEISKWLSGEHNFTLRSIAKLEAELGESLIYVPKIQSFTATSGITTHMTVYKNDLQRNNLKYEFFTNTINTTEANVKAAGI